MARRKRRKTHVSEDRDFSTPNQSLSKDDLRTKVRAIEDRRLHYPSRVRPAKGLSLLSSRKVLDDRRSEVGSERRRPKRVSQQLRHRVRGVLYGNNARVLARKLVVRAVPTRIRFSDPKRVAICVRRHTRREVLFALKKTGKGARAHKRKWNENSEVRC